MEIGYEYLPKPGKTALMDAARDGDEAAFRAALAAGDKLTDVDASGWTPLMYAAGSHDKSEESEIIKAGANVNTRSKGRNGSNGSGCNRQGGRGPAANRG